MNELQFWPLAQRVDDCWIWQGKKDAKGYGFAHFNRSKTFAHRIAWELTHGPIPDGLCVCHSCDTPLCVNPAHLWLGTRSENTLDRHAKGRSRGPVGTRQHDAKLNSEVAREIRKRYANGDANQYALAREYGVTQTTISGIWRGRLWKIEARPARHGE